MFNSGTVAVMDGDERMLECTPSWASAQIELRCELKAWIREACERQMRIPWGCIASTDQGDFTQSWAGYALLTGDDAPLEFMRWLRDEFSAWMEGHFYHGYPRIADVHHGTEPYFIFLSRLLRASPDDERTQRLMLDAAHHIGNWSNAGPPWYDWEHNLFRSWWLGTERVRVQPPEDINVPDHFRLLQILLPLCWLDMRGYATWAKDEWGASAEQFLTLAMRYADRWCNEILADAPHIPPFITTHTRWLDAGAEYWLHPAVFPKRFYSTDADAFARARERLLNSYYTAEYHVAAGSIDVFMDLYQLTGELRYADAARVILNAVAVAIDDPHAHPPGALIAKYRLLTGDDAFDAKVIESLGEGLETRIQHNVNKAVMILCHRWGEHPLGIGHRFDEVRWGWIDDCGVVRNCDVPSPATLMLAFRITGDVQYATYAFELATARLRLARCALRDGREHGCAGSNIGAVVHGHGRDGGAGAITSTLLPLTMGAYMHCGGDEPIIVFKHKDGKIGLPESVAALCLPAKGGEAHVWLHNCNDDDVEMIISHGQLSRTVLLPPNTTIELQLESDFIPNQP